MDATEFRKKPVTKESGANTSGPRLKIVPQAPQPVPAEALDASASDTVQQDPEDLKPADRYVFADDEPARDVGGEIGRRRVPLNAWQMVWALTGAVLVTAGATWMAVARRPLSR